MNDLTEREKSIFLFIKDFHSQKGYSPTIREIQKGVFLASPYQIQIYLDRLCEKGYISRTEKISRSIIIKKAL